MRILVTGGSGFLGFEAILRIALRGDVAIAFDTQVGKSLLNLSKVNSNVIPVAGDITDLANLVQVFSTYRPDAVLHFAAIVGVPASLGSPSNILRVNVQGSLNLFEAMRLYGVKRIIHMSSEEVYGDFIRPVADEEHPQTPLMPYGVAKLSVEHFGRTYREMYGLECINLRTSWVYGTRLDRPRPPMSYMNAALAGQALHMAEGAETVTDFTYVDDVIDGVFLALDHRVHLHDVYNIASGEGTSDGDLVAIVRSLVPNADISVGPGRRQFMPGVRIPIKGALNVSRAQAEFGYAPRFNIRQGLITYAAEWKQNAAKANP